MFEVWDRHREEVVGMAMTKRQAVWIGKRALDSYPRRVLRDLVIRPVWEPPLRVYTIGVSKPISPKRR